MAKIVILLAIIGLAYWYWSGPYQESGETSEAERLRENAATMQRCIVQEKSMEGSASVGGVIGIGSSGKNAEQICANKHNLYLWDGKWYDKRE